MKESVIKMEIVRMRRGMNRMREKDQWKKEEIKEGG
jgi:hypothetical protein